MTLTYGSLCTGYDGIGMGLALAGLDLAKVFSAEMEPTVARVLELEQPEVPNLGDIKTADFSPYAGIDILSSGDPCQSISVAGRQLGKEDPRFLWPWVREAYRTIRPRVIFLENVANMVSHDKGQTMAERFAHLREDGYAVRWAVLGACAVGAPHHRHRWYAVATYIGADAPGAKREGGGAICGAPRAGGRRVLPTPNAREGGERGFPSREHAARREADPMRSLNLEDAIALLPTPTVTNSHGNTVNNRGELLLPGVAASLLPTPTVADSRNTRNATAGRSEGAQFNAGWTLCDVAHADTWGKYAAAVALWEQITGIPAPSPTVPGPKSGVRLNPELPEWMMGLRPGLLTDRMDRNPALRAAGNGVVPLAAAAAWNLLTEEENGMLW